MRQRSILLAPAALLLLWTLPAAGATLLIRGKVVMQDGSPPAKSVNIERFCYSVGTRIVANTTKTGQFVYTADVDALSGSNCVLRAAAKGFESTAVPISHLNWWSDPNLPEITLREHDASLGADNTLTSTNIYFASSSVPPNARQPWSNAIRAMEKNNFALAETQARIVVKEAPKMAEAWDLLGDAAQRQNKHAEAAEALERALQADPKLLRARVALVRSYLQLQKWAEAEAATKVLLENPADTQYPEIHANRAIALLNLGDLAGAENSVREGIRRDTKRQLPRTELILGSILEARGDYDGARERMQKYLELDPRASDATQIREHMNSLGKTGAPTAVPVLQAVDASVDVAGEAWVPGGMKALAQMALIPGEPGYQTFFEEYCRAIGREVSVGTSQGLPRYTQSLRAFLASVTQLIPLGVKRDDIATIRISAASRPDRQQAERVLALLGWTIEERDGKVHVEPGYRPEDALLQTVASALGIDQITMQETLESGAAFEFQIVSENARLVGGNMWTQILTENAVPPGGLAAVFATDMRIAKTCAGLNAMDASTAGALISAVGLRNLAAKYADLLYRYGHAFLVVDNRVAVPGGAAADPAWQKLTGANPRNPGQFLSAILEKETGRLATFYTTLARADAAHQRYFTQTPERAERTFRWFRDSVEMRRGVLLHTPGPSSELLQSLPLDASANIRFPGGQNAWFPDSEVPLDNPRVVALVPIAQLEQKRGSPFDEPMVRLLARNHAEWSALYPYFEELKGLGQEDFVALSQFTEAAQRSGERNQMLGEWYSLVELITRGVKAGSLDSGSAARLFRQACLELSDAQHSAKSIGLLRTLAGEGELEERIAEHLLRLDRDRKLRFDRTLDLLHSPKISDARPSDAAVALSALVYAASLDPALLLLNEDSQLLTRHRYATDNGAIFSRSILLGSQDPKGTHFSGGFVGFEDASKRLMGGAKAAPRVPVVARVTPEPVAAFDSDEEVDAPDFRSDTKMVEVYTTVTDSRGRYVDNLSLTQFTLMDRKSPQAISAFEPQTSELSVALLLDTTGSMVDTIASLKRAAIKLIDSLRPGDSVAVYSFSDQVEQLAPYSTDRGASKRAVMKTRPFGNTALYDAIARAGHEMTGRSGKKVIVVFTDGHDTASMVTVEAAIERAKLAGVPVYTIAEGEAVINPELLQQLTAISNATGGVPFQVKNPDDMAKVFERVAEDLAHGYLLFFQAPSSDDHGWREIEVLIGGQKDLRIRAREGYYP